MFRLVNKINEITKNDEKNNSENSQEFVKSVR